MKFKIGDTVKGITFGTFGYEAKEGKIVEINEYNPTCMYAIISDGYKWHLRTETVELIEKEPIPVYIKNELNKGILLNKEEDDKIMYKVIVTKYNDEEGVQVTEFNYINEYAVIDDYLVLEDETNKVKTHIQNDQILEFEVHYE